MSIELTIVIPAYNESSRIVAGYERIAPVLASLGEDSELEIIVVDDGSTDDTLKRAHSVYGHLANALFIQQPSNIGKGAALRLGIALARGRHVITADADMAIDPRHIPVMAAALSASAIVPGSRAMEGSIRYNAALRTVAGSAFNRMVRRFTGLTLRDTQCGLKGFQLGAARALALLALTDGFAFDVEALYLASKLGLSVTPLPVEWLDVGDSSVRPGRDGWKMLSDIRHFRSTRYENPVVELTIDVTASEVDALAREARTQGLALARGDSNTLLLLGRNDALAGLGIAAGLKGTLRTAFLDELAGRTFEAV